MNWSSKLPIEFFLKIMLSNCTLYVTDTRHLNQTEKLKRAIIEEHEAIEGSTLQLSFKSWINYVVFSSIVQKVAQVTEVDSKAHERRAPFFQPKLSYAYGQALVWFLLT